MYKRQGIINKSKLTFKTNILKYFKFKGILCEVHSYLQNQCETGLKYSAKFSLLLLNNPINIFTTVLVKYLCEVLSKRRLALQIYVMPEIKNLLCFKN